MKKNICFIALGLSAIISVNLSHAQSRHEFSPSPDGGAMHGGGIGPVGNLLTCGSPDHGFVVRHTASIAIIDGLYTSGHSYVSFLCKKENKRVAAHAPSAGKVIWTCEETRLPGTTDEGALHAVVTTGGVLGQTFAEISRKQVYPLANQPVESFQCTPESM